MPVEDSEAFCAIARQQIVNARIKLALGQLSIGEESELWQIVECIEALVKMRTICFTAELEKIDRELEHRFRRQPPYMR